MAETNPTWIYQADGSAKIVDLAPSADAPEGWSRDIAVIADPALATADAVTASLEGRQFTPAVEPAPAAADQLPTSSMDELLAAREKISDLESAIAAAPDATGVQAAARIAELEAIIAAGKAENEKLATELDSSEDAIEAAEAQVTRMTDELADAKAENDRLTAALAKAEADLVAARSGQRSNQNPRR